MIETLQQAWHSFLELITGIVIPDWGALVGLLPVILLVGVIGPILTIVFLIWLVYAARKPRPHVQIVDGPQPAPRSADGAPVYPLGEPFCARDRLVYPFGATECDVCHDQLSVFCPKCGVARSAKVDTCGNCGLVLRVVPRLRVLGLRAARPKAGGAAAA